MHAEREVGGRFSARPDRPAPPASGLSAYASSDHRRVRVAEPDGTNVSTPISSRVGSGVNIPGCSIIMIMTDTTTSQLPSGRFVLRIEPELHALLRDEAERLGLSLNEYCARKLAAPGADVGGPAGAAFEWALSVTRGRLRGMLAFGSWARNDLAEDSDVDLLIVIDLRLPVDRDLYRRWDESPVRWQGRRVEPHFVHLPAEDLRVTGFWAEAALDGVVLYDPDFSLSRHLVSIRKRILAGSLSRREVHGHPYWVEVA